ncbi:MAG TPA: ABC transporter permease [Candidatus Limnocylindrales bacterium]|nr:ABC transporter permease [Candidatus Limnocylindrales bacterium]
MVAAWLLLVCAISLIASAAHYGDAIALGGLRRAVLDAPPADRSPTASTRLPREAIDDVDAVVREELTLALRGPGGEIVRVTRSGPFIPAPTGRPAAPDRMGEIVRLAAFEGIDRHAALVDGRWPEPGHDPVEVTLSQGGAAALSVSAGDVFTVVGERGNDLLEVVVVGIWRPDPLDAFWHGATLDVSGVSTGTRFVEYGPLVADPADVVAVAPPGSLTVEWRALPTIDGFRADELDAAIADLRALPARLRAALSQDRQVQVTTALPEILSGISRSITVSRTGVLLLSLQFAVLAAYAVVLVAGVLVERRRAQVALLRSRGATNGHLVVMAVAEAALLAAAAAVVAPLVAVALVPLIGDVGPVAGSNIVVDTGLGGTTLAVTAIAALASIVALSVPTLTSISSLSGVRAALARQGGRTLPQRIGLDLALLALAGLALWQLRLYGAPLTVNARGVLGVDPLLVAAPAIGLVAGAVLAIRLVPRLGEIAERVLVRRRGAVAPLGGRQLARRPLSYSRSALLLMLAVSLGTFAFAQSATWHRSQIDQAAYRAATDVRLVVSGFPAVPTWAQGTAYRAVPGIERVEPVLRRRIDVRRAVRDGDLLAIDAATAVEMVDLPADVVAADGTALLAELAATRPEIGGVAIDGRPVRIAVAVDARLEAEPELSRGIDLDPQFAGITLSAVVEDGDGRLIPLVGQGAARLVGDGQRLVASVRAANDPSIEPAWPFRLVALELQVNPQFVAAVGTIDLVSIEASADPTGDTWSPVDLDPGAAGWGWERTEQGGSIPVGTPDGRPGRLLLHTAPGANGPIFPIFVGPPTIFRLSAPDPLDALPAIVNPVFLERTGLAVGDTVTALSLGQALTIRVAGSVNLFPPLDPGAPFVIVDRQSFERDAFERDAVSLRPDEWWFRTAAGTEAGVLERLRGEPISAEQVIGRDELARELASDPIGLGVIGALGLGTVAALAFAAIGFLVGVASSATERFGEFALLRALGLSGRELSTWLSLENAFLLGVGLVAGSAVGLVLAWVVLPVSTLTETGAPTVPPATVVIPWPDLIPIWGLAVVLLVLSVVVVARTIRAVRISSVLRARDG